MKPLKLNVKHEVAACDDSGHGIDARNDSCGHENDGHAKFTRSSNELGEDDAYEQRQTV